MIFNRAWVDTVQDKQESILYKSFCKKRFIPSSDIIKDEKIILGRQYDSYN